MTESISEVRDSILRLLYEAENRQLPRKVVEQSFSTQFDIEEIKTAISTLLDDFVIDLVVAYPPDYSGLNTGRPHWFLKILSPAESQEIRELSPLKLNLLRILQETDDEPFPGEVPVDEVRAKLIAKGFPEEKIERVHIADRVDRVSVTSDNGLVPCYMIIPEYEKTEEHKQFLEEAALRATEKELRDMKFDEESRESNGENDDE